jgi:hypothetical protein
MPIHVVSPHGVSFVVLPFPPLMIVLAVDLFSLLILSHLFCRLLSILNRLVVCFIMPVLLGFWLQGGILVANNLPCDAFLAGTVIGATAASFATTANT